MLEASGNKASEAHLPLYWFYWSLGPGNVQQRHGIWNTRPQNYGAWTLWKHGDVDSTIAVLVGPVALLESGFGAGAGMNRGAGESLRKFRIHVTLRGARSAFQGI